MRAKDLKVGFPIYYIESTKLKFDNAIIENIEYLTFKHKSVIRLNLHKYQNKSYSYLGYTDININNDIVYITKDEYDNRITHTKSAPGIIIGEPNSKYWENHQKEFNKIKWTAFKYRAKKFLKHFCTLS